MQGAQQDITPLQAAQMLDWLIAMGADEIVSEKPCNRFEVITEQPKPATPVITQPLKPLAVVPVEASDTTAILAAATLQELAAAVAGFNGCGLRKQAMNTCFLGGNLASRILVLADRPRTEEDKSGEVMAGKNAVLLDNMLKAIGLSLNDVMLANAIPLRPPGNRPPSEAEIRQCAAIAAKLVELAKPGAILALGGLPGQMLAGGAQSIARQRGTWLETGGVPLMPTFHPDELIKTPNLKRLAWRDLLMLRARLDEVAP